MLFLRDKQCRHSSSLSSMVHPVRRVECGCGSCFDSITNIRAYIRHQTALRHARNAPGIDGPLSRCSHFLTIWRGEGRHQHEYKSGIGLAVAMITHSAAVPGTEYLVLRGGDSLAISLPINSNQKLYIAKAAKTFSASLLHRAHVPRSWQSAAKSISRTRYNISRWLCTCTLCAVAGSIYSSRRPTCHRKSQNFPLYNTHSLLLEKKANTAHTQARDNRLNLRD